MAATTPSVNSYHIPTLWLPKIQPQTSLTLHWHSVSGWDSKHVGINFTMNGSQYLVYEWMQLVLAMGPYSRFGSGSGSNPTLNRCNGFPHKTRHFNITTLPPIKYLSSDHIMMWSIRRLCSSSRSVTSRSQICDPTNICWVAIENTFISLKFAHFSQSLNEYQSDRKLEPARWKSSQNCKMYVLITSRYDENSDTQLEPKL